MATPDPMLPWVKSIVETTLSRHPAVHKETIFNPQLRNMVLNYRNKHNLPSEQQQMIHRWWYGASTVDNRLLTVVGFEKCYSEVEGHWLYITDFPCLPNDYQASRAFSHLLKFINDLPLMVRGFVWLDNPSVARIAARRGWRSLGSLFQKEAKNVGVR